MWYERGKENQKVLQQICQIFFFFFPQQEFNEIQELLVVTVMTSYFFSFIIFYFSELYLTAAEQSINATC